MGSLTIALQNTAQVQRVYTRALTVLQNNISNVDTPGYAVQTAQFLNQPFNPDIGTPGGVAFGGLVDSRSTFAERSVQEQQGYLNQNQQLSTDLSRLNAAFDLNSPSSIPSTLSAFFNSFSQLSVNPNDQLSRQQVIDAASTAVQSFHNSSAKLGAAAGQTDAQINQTVNAINADVTAIQTINTNRRNNPASQHDPGLDSQVYAKLEDLSQYVNIQSISQPDGTVNVYLGGQTPLLVGTQAFGITAAPGNNSTVILDQNNKDISSQVSTGTLNALLNEKNTVLPGYRASLDQLAQSFADTVNGQLRNGVDSAGASPSVDLFTYNPAGKVASSLQVSGITPAEIAAADPAAPGGNGNALTLAQLADAKTINGLSFSQFYGTIAAKFGQDLSSAQQNTKSAQALLSQAQTSREQISGVSLDQQAALLLQYQQAYQAAGNMFRVLNQLTQDAINLIQ